jgi:hypothetical protein
MHQLVGGEEVFGRHAGGIPSPPCSRYPRRVTEDSDKLGSLRALPMLPVSQNHGTTPL